MIAGNESRVQEVRAVPFGKGDGQFGRVTRTGENIPPPATPLSVRLRASGVPLLGEAVRDLLSDQNDLVFIAQEGVGDSFSRAWRARAAVGYPQTSAWNAGKVNSTGLFTRD